MALATLLLAVVAHGTPAENWIGWTSDWKHVAAESALWLGAFAIFSRCSASESERWWVSWLHRTGRRTGLVTTERLGAMLALVALATTSASAGGILLRGLILVCFIGFLTADVEERVPSRIPQTAVTAAPDPPEGASTRVFRWQLEAGYLSEECVLTVALSAERAVAAKQTNPGHGFGADGEPDFRPWVLEGATPEIDRIAAELGTWCATKGWSRYVEICLVLSFVQHLPYATDLDTTGQDDYWRYPIETLTDGTGDCEDSAILGATILRRMGHTTAIFFTVDHAALAVQAPPSLHGGNYIDAGGHRFYYCETTATG